MKTIFMSAVIFLSAAAAHAQNYDCPEREPVPIKQMDISFLTMPDLGRICRTPDGERIEDADELAKKMASLRWGSDEVCSPPEGIWRYYAGGGFGNQKEWAEVSAGQKQESWKRALVNYQEDAAKYNSVIGGYLDAQEACVDFAKNFNRSVGEVKEFKTNFEDKAQSLMESAAKMDRAAALRIRNYYANPKDEQTQESLRTSFENTVKNVREWKKHFESEYMEKAGARVQLGIGNAARRMQDASQ